jgi:hypothetical protein
MLRSRRIAGSLSLAAGALAVTVTGFAGPALAAPAALAAGAKAGPVSTDPARGTPQLAPRPSGATEQVRQLVKCGKMMYAVGRFKDIRWNSRTWVRSNAFSFRATSPFTMSDWKPDVDGPVNSIAFDGSDCYSAYLGGKFTSVHGESATNIAKVSTTTGRLRTGFARDANGQVETLVVHDGHVLAGGFFTSINGGPSYYASLNHRTGDYDGYLSLGISGHYKYSGVAYNPTRVYNQQVSPSGFRLLAEGDFTSVGGRHREQVVMLRLGSTQATVTKWHSPEFDRHCSDSEPFYVRAAAWSPDSRRIYIADTGDHPLSLTGGGKRYGLCDAAAAFPVTEKKVRREWINYTGCDSLYSAAADSRTAYFGGHERWADNRHGCNVKGWHAVDAPGMVGLSVSNGGVMWDPTRSRGLGADDMLITSRGLWIASDNYGSVAEKCAHHAHTGICFMPYE